MKRLIGLVSANYSVGDFSLLTSQRPIASIPFGGRYRLIDFPLSNMVNANVTTLGVITPHLYRSILDHIGNGKPWNLSRKSGGLFILPGSTYGFDARRGKVTIKDIIGNKQFLERAKEDYVVISATNKIFNIDYLDVLEKHIKNNASVTLCYKKVLGEVAKDEYVVLVDADINNSIKDVIKLKKNKKDQNMYMDTLIINKDLLLHIIEWYKDQSYLDILDVIKENLNHIGAIGYEFKGYVKSINNVYDYMKASNDMIDGDVIEELFMNGRMIYTKVHDSHPVRYGKDADVRQSIVATGTTVYGKVRNSVVFRDAYISEGSDIKNSVIMQKATVGKNVHLENVILEKNAFITDGQTLIGTETKPIIITRYQYK